MSTGGVVVRNEVLTVHCTCRSAESGIARSRVLGLRAGVAVLGVLLDLGLLSVGMLGVGVRGGGWRFS